jgi:2'-5' RNA ligase
MRNTTPDFEQAWSRFLSLRSLRLVQDTLEWEWSRGRTDYLAFLVVIGDREAQQHLSSIAGRISDIPGVELYPPSYWHITIKGAGFVVDHPSRPDDISEEQLGEMVQAARDVFEKTPAFDVQIGLPSAFPEVAHLEVLDGGRVRELNSRLLERVPWLPRYPWDGPNWLSHISIARFTSSEGLDLLKERLTDLRRDPPGPSFRIREVQAIRARLAEATPVLNVIATYPLS